MTFYEAAIEVLRREGRPLHFKEITEIAIRENLLSHVGQTPEETMAARLAAMARREVDRKIVAIKAGTFGLAEWGAQHVPSAVEPEPAPPAEPEGPAVRGRERHPVPLNLRGGTGREREQKKRRREEEQARAAERPQEPPREKKRRPRRPPPSIIYYDLLTEKGGGPAPILELAKLAFERELMGSELSQDQAALARILSEENRRRAEAGKGPLFVLDEAGTVALVAGAEPPPRPREEGEPRREERLEREERVPARREERKEERPALGPAATRLSQIAYEQKKNVQRSIRRRLAEIDPVAFERVALMLLEATGYRDLRIAKRSAKEGPVYTGKRRLGALDVRVAVRLLRGNREVTARDVEELREDMVHYAAQLGLILAAGDLSREARNEAQAVGKALVTMMGGEALAERFVSKGLGVSRHAIEAVEMDERFFGPPAHAGGPEREAQREGAEGGESSEQPGAEQR